MRYLAEAVVVEDILIGLGVKEPTMVEERIKHVMTPGTALVDQPRGGGGTPRDHVHDRRAGRLHHRGGVGAHLVGR